MSAETKIVNLFNYITGSAGGWPSDTNVGVLASVDFLIETGSDDIYFPELNTNIGILGPLSEQRGVFNEVSDYAASKSCDTAYIYGTLPAAGKDNPSSFQQPIISSSFAQNSISCSFEYFNTDSSSYFAQRGDTNYAGSFHFFVQTPWWVDDTLLNIVSGSFNKSKFRDILGASPESESLIPLFNTSSYTPNTNFPDYVIKNPTGHATIQTGQLGLNTYISSSDSYENANLAGNITEKFIISSGSYCDGNPYIFQSKRFYLMTPDEHILLQSYGGSVASEGRFNQLESKLIRSGSEAWIPTPMSTKMSASGSLIHMYDGSTKQAQDVEVGDVVKSYSIVGMPDESSIKDWGSFTTSDLSGSTASDSIVVSVKSSEHYGYYLINDSIKLPVDLQTTLHGGKLFTKTDDDIWRWKTPRDLIVGDKFLTPDVEELEVTSISQVSEEETFYGMDVEDIDTYFQSNILVHNIPPKCFVAGTPITMGDGTTKAIELVEVGDEVTNYDFETKEVKVNKVTSIETPTHADIIEISFGDKKTKNTFDHPYWVVGSGQKGWSSYKPQWTEERYDIKSEQLEVGDKCLELHNGELREVEITNLEENINPVQTYSLEVETHHNYFANNILVHNKMP